MYEIVNLDNWNEVDEQLKYGNGASEKTWLYNMETKVKGMFKLPKLKVRWYNYE